MEISVAILLSLAVIWLISQDCTKSSDIPRGIPTLSAIILGSIVSIDWFLGRHAILGHQGGWFHTIFKLLLVLLLVVFVSSGLTAMRSSRNIGMALFNIVWAAGLSALLLKFLGAL